jgi:hypothetical protein
MKKSAIEKQCKEQLSAREITPSSGSWDRLDAMLTVAEEKPKRNFKLMYAAASVLGFLLMSSLFFNQNKKETVVPNNTIAVKESKSIPDEKKSPATINWDKRVETSKLAEQQLASKGAKKESDSNSVSAKSEIKIAQKEEIQEQQIPIITRGFADRLERSGKNQIINQKAEQQVVLRKSKYVNVDELLASVDPLSKKKNSSIQQSNVKVNSNELLSQVDGELELSFREKALKVVNQKIKTATVALSNRNSE